MARELITIRKDGKTAQCERFQLKAMEAKGWAVAPPSVAAHNPEEPVLEVPVPAGLRRVYKGDQVGWCDDANMAKALASGWSLEAPDQAETTQEHEGDAALVAILERLDVTDDDLWAKDGQLKMGAFNKLFDRSETRESIQTAWPGLNRETLAVAQSLANEDDDGEQA